MSSRTLEVIVRFAVIASCLIAGAVATPASQQQQAPDLRPVDGVYSSPSAVLEPYRIAVRDALLAEHDYRKCQMVVLPSFQAEWVVYVVQDDTQRPSPGRLFYKAMRKMLWAEMQSQIEKDAPNPRSYSVGPEAQVAALRKVKKEVDVRVVDLDASTIAVLEGAWSAMLARTRYPPAQQEILTIGVDGETYVAANWSFGAGSRSGETWSPEKGTPTYDLVAIAERLRDLALAPQPRQAKLKAEVVAMSNDLQARLKGLK
jgi:hypothetical protein